MLRAEARQGGIRRKSAVYLVVNEHFEENSNAVLPSRSSYSELLKAVAKILAKRRHQLLRPVGCCLTAPHEEA